MQIKLRNKIHRSDHIGGATIVFTPSAPGTPVTITTNSLGVATVTAASLPAGNYTCTITAPHTSPDPVGPALLSSGTVPTRVYRPVTLTVVRTATGFSSVVPGNSQFASVTNTPGTLTVDIQPVWMKSATSSGRSQAVSMIVVHHTACALSPAVNTFLSEKGPHYMIDTDGQIVKWVQDSRAAWHAGVARWDGHSDINGRSIGIEIVHATGAYPAAQYTALLDLLTRIRAAFPNIDSRDIVGHSDVGTNASGRLGRKSGDPGAQFEWVQLENRGLGMVPASGPPSPNIYAGFFTTVPGGSLRRGDNDARHRFGGAVRPGFTGTPVRELQDDLKSIGYSVGTPDGDFGDKSHHAVIAFQEHFFAGSRGHSADGRVDFLTAGWIKGVAGAVGP